MKILRKAKQIAKQIHDKFPNAKIFLDTPTKKHVFIVTDSELWEEEKFVALVVKWKQEIFEQDMNIFFDTLENKGLWETTIRLY